MQNLVDFLYAVIKNKAAVKEPVNAILIFCLCVTFILDGQTIKLNNATSHDSS